MSSMTWLFVVVIMVTINAFLNLSSGFKEQEISSEVRLYQFCIGVGMAIWGWMIYFSG
jgi:hypothetical protein